MAFDIEPYRRLYPFRSHWLDLDGLRYHYLDEGQGHPIVFVHGNPTWSFYFRELVKDLRNDYRCIVPDHIGCGLSDKPGDDRYEYVLQRRIDDLEKLLDHLGVREKATLVLHDWGGAIGMGWALRRPGRLARLVLLNTAAFLMPASKRLPFSLWFVRNCRGLAALAVRGFNGFAWPATFMACRKPMLPELRAAYRGPYDSWQNRIATLRFVQDIPLKPSDRSYATARWIDEHVTDIGDTPMLICWGEHDFVFDHHFLTEWRRRFPRAEVHTFSDAGHYVLEDAGDRIIPLVREFLRNHPLDEVRS